MTLINFYFQTSTSVDKYVTFSYITVAPYDSNYSYLILQSSKSPSLTLIVYASLSISDDNIAIFV